LDSIIASKKVEQEEEQIIEESLEDEIMVEKCLEMPQLERFSVNTASAMMVPQSAPMSRSMAAPKMKKKLKSRSRRRKRDKEDSDLMVMDSAPRGASFGKIGIAAEKKAVKIERYKKAGAAFEYGERHQFFSGSNSAGQINQFWLEIMQNIVNGNGAQILSENFVYASDTNYNIVYALAFCDVPFNKGTIDSKTQEKNLQVSSTENFLVLVKKMEEKLTDPLNLDLIISQKFYDPQEKFTYDETDSSIKTIKQVTEFLIGKIYESQITFTNISENQLKLKVIQQIPQGSLPVYNLDDLKIHDVIVNGLQT
jgi:hypothetical protein